MTSLSFLCHPSSCFRGEENHLQNLCCMSLLKAPGSSQNFLFQPLSPVYFLTEVWDRIFVLWSPVCPSHSYADSNLESIFRRESSSFPKGLLLLYPVCSLQTFSFFFACQFLWVSGGQTETKIYKNTFRERNNVMRSSSLKRERSHCLDRPRDDCICCHRNILLSSLYHQPKITCCFREMIRTMMCYFGSFILRF